MRWVTLFLLSLCLVAGGCGGDKYASAGSYGYSYSYRPYYSGSYGGYYSPSYGGYYGYYPNYSYSYYPSYGYSYPSYGSTYSEYLGATPEKYASPEASGYRYYPEHVDGGRKFPAGWYKYIQSNGLWFRYGAGYEQGVPVAPSPDPLPPDPTPGPPLAAPAPKGAKTMPPADDVPTEAELRKFRLMLEMLDKIKKP